MGPSGDFKDRIREIMGDMTQAELARRMGVAQQTAQKYLSGERTPKIDKVSLLADMFGVNPLWLAGYDEPKYKDSTKQNDVTISNTGSGSLIAPVDSNNTTVNTSSRGEYTDQEFELIEMYKQLSLIDRAKVVSYIAELLGINNKKR
jgi:transcriptional regulator with XRE-family HTH domain